MPHGYLDRKLPVTLQIVHLPEGVRTISALAKHYYRSSSRVVPIRRRNAILREVGNHQDLVEHFRDQSHHGFLTITIPDLGPALHVRETLPPPLVGP